MVTILSRPMAKMGRPKTSEDTTGVRLHTDLAEMLSDLATVLPESIAQICDPLLRPEITHRWEMYRPQIEAVKAAKKAAEEAVQKARQEAASITGSKQNQKTSGKKQKPES